MRHNTSTNIIKISSVLLGGMLTLGLVMPVNAETSENPSKSAMTIAIDLPEESDVPESVIKNMPQLTKEDVLESYNNILDYLYFAEYQKRYEEAKKQEEKAIEEREMAEANARIHESTMSEMISENREDYDVEAEYLANTRNDIVYAAKKCAEEGVPYVYGRRPVANLDSIKNGTDCSGFVKWVYEFTTGINTGQSTAQFIGKEISFEELELGDLGMIKKPGAYENHIGIYVGTNNLGQAMWCHASTVARKVIVTTYSEFEHFYTVLEK